MTARPTFWREHGMLVVFGLILPVAVAAALALWMIA